ncbi:unnamed protein product [Protopolystoma xenopodis]|uniref:Uncharacterized protein n=1 Tax=Protopolystoma xenopodis TaxID=117903 RepID=A0A448XKY9_9PLAT|nr:unnamed protein product [Protopolystoma xenopodis]
MVTFNSAEIFILWRQTWSFDRPVDSEARDLGANGIEEFRVPESSLISDARITSKSASAPLPWQSFSSRPLPLDDEMRATEPTLSTSANLSSPPPAFTPEQLLCIPSMGASSLSTVPAQPPLNRAFAISGLPVCPSARLSACLSVRMLVYPFLPKGGLSAQFITICEYTPTRSGMLYADTGRPAASPTADALTCCLPYRAVASLSRRSPVQADPATCTTVYRPLRRPSPAVGEAGLAQVIPPPRSVPLPGRPTGSRRQSPVYSQQALQFFWVDESLK